MILFSHTSCIQSATVQIAAISILSLKYFLYSTSLKYSRERAVTSLKATPAPASHLNGYSQSGLLGLINATASSGISSGTW